MTHNEGLQVLGLSRGATEDEIKTAFRERAKKTHPDLNHGSGEAEFKRVLAAYSAVTASVSYSYKTRPKQTQPEPGFTPPPAPKHPTTTFRTGPSPFFMPKTKITQLFSFGLA